MKARLLFEPRDIWIGVFWDRRPGGLHVYICVVPCAPLLLVFPPPQEECAREVCDLCGAEPGQKHGDEYFYGSDEWRPCSKRG